MGIKTSKVRSIAVGIFVLTACSFSRQLSALDRLPGDTITNNKGSTLQHDVVNLIMGREVKAAPSCRRPRIMQTEIVGQPRTLGRMMQWTEKWTVDHCGTKRGYLIHFDFRGSLGTFKIEPLNS